MAISMAVFMFAGLLLLVAVTGGGFEVKELKVPKVGRTSRVASFASSLIVLFLGLHLERGPAAAEAAVAEQKPQKTVEAPAPPPATPQIIVLARSAEELGMTVNGPATARQGQSSPPALSPEPVTKKQPTTPAAASKTKKQVPWEQKPRRWLQRLKGSAG